MFCPKLQAKSLQKSIRNLACRRPGRRAGGNLNGPLLALKAMALGVTRGSHWTYHLLSDRIMFKLNDMQVAPESCCFWLAFLQPFVWNPKGTQPKFKTQKIAGCTNLEITAISTCLRPSFVKSRRWDTFYGQLIGTSSGNRNLIGNGRLSPHHHKKAEIPRLRPSVGTTLSAALQTSAKAGVQYVKWWTMRLYQINIYSTQLVSYIQFNSYAIISNCIHLWVYQLIDVEFILTAKKVWKGERFLWLEVSLRG